jgi:hypothetical protein
MTEALSQDELDALLSNFGDEGSSGDAFDDDLSGSESLSDGMSSFSSSSSADPQLTIFYIDAASAFRNGAEGIGVMLASTSKFNKSEDSDESGSSITSKFKNNGFIIELPLTSPVKGSIFLRLSENEAKSLISAATSTDKSEISFTEDQSGTAVEIITPALVAVTKSWSGKLISGISTGQPRGFTLSAENPFSENQYHEIKGNLVIEGILNDTVSLIISESLAQSLKKNEKQQEMSSSAAASSANSSDDSGKKPY